MISLPAFALFNQKDSVARQATYPGLFLSKGAAQLVSFLATDRLTATAAGLLV